MDLEKRAKQQSLKVIISEAIMFITVIITVVVLAFVVSGYWLNGNFEVERQGMLQINTVPTGASVSVDDESPWFQRTNTSKILSDGEHTVVLSKEGYDTWSKTVNIKKGLLYRLNYPHLFLKERFKESVYDTTTTTFATISPSRKLILLVNNTTKWELIDLDNEEIKPTVVDVSKVFLTANQTSDPELFSGTILSASWDSANNHVLLKTKIGEQIEWVLIDIRNTAKSINLTRVFAADFEQVDIFDNSADNLLAIRNGNLHKIDVNARQISAVIVDGVVDYDFYDSEILFSSKTQIGLLKLGQDKATSIKDIDTNAKVLIGKFYDNKYIYVIEESMISVYQKNDFEMIAQASISFVPQNAKIGYDGDFVFMSSGTNFATFDMESMQITEWSVEANNYGWLNGYMVYTVKDGELSVYDFDGLNHRSLATNVSNHFPVTITNEKYLYYFSDDALVREWLISR